MAVVVLKVIALIFQRIERLIFDLPPRPATAHEGINVAFTHPYVCHPTEVLHLLIAYFPVLDDIDPYVRLRSIEWHVIDKAKAMYETRSPLVPLRRGDAASLCGGLDLLEQIGMIPFFDPQDIAEVVVVQSHDMWSIGTEAVFSNDELEVGMILPQFAHKAFGGIAFAIIFVRAIAVHNRLGHERNDGPLVR